MHSKPAKKLGPRLDGDFIPGKGTNDAVASQKISDKISAYHTTNGKKKR